MSSVFKQGFSPIKYDQDDAFVIDVSKREKELAKAVKERSKIIRSVNENSEVKPDESTEGVFSSFDGENDVSRNVGADGFAGGLGDLPDATEEYNELRENDEAYAMLDGASDLAREIRDDARQKAADAIAKAEAEAEEIRQNAYNEGFEKGLEEGNMEAMRRADEYLEGLKIEQDAAIAQRMDELMLEIENKEHKLVDITCALVEKLTNVAMDENKPALIYMINQCMADIDNSKKFVISVSEDNYNYVNDNKERITGATNPNISIEVFGDAKLGSTDCKIETESGIIDLSMDIQIKNLINAIKLLTD